MSLPLLDRVKYSEESEAMEILEKYINTEKEANSDKVKATVIALLKSPERKVRRATLNALKSTKFVDKDIISTCAIMTKDDPEKSVRDLASETVLAVLKVDDENLKKELVRSVIKLIAKGKAMVDVTEIVNSIGIEFAKNMIEDPEIDDETKEFIKFAIEYLEKS